MSRLARFLQRLQAAAMELTRDQAAALESLRLVNRELLVVAYAEVPEEVARKCDKAREEIVSCIRDLAPLPEGTETPVEELPPGEHRARVEQASRKFAPLTDPPGLN